MNNVSLIGNLVKDAELKVLPGTDGETVLEFTLAWTDHIKKKDGTTEKKSQFIDCAVYKQYGRDIQKSMVKGLRVGLEGALQYSSWKGDDGATRSKHRLLVKHVDFLSDKRDEPAAGSDE